jgi:hypothetical protein
VHLHKTLPHGKIIYTNIGTVNTRNPEQMAILSIASHQRGLLTHMTQTHKDSTAGLETA